MGGPWEDYQDVSGTAPGPWEDYTQKTPVKAPVVNADKPEGFWNDLMDAGGKFIEGMSNPEPSAIRAFSPTFGAAANVVGQTGKLFTNVIGAGLRSAYNVLPKVAQEGLSDVGRMISTNPVVDLTRTVYGQVPQDVQNDIGNIGAIASLVPMVKGAGVTLPIAKRAITTAGKKTGITDALSGVKQAIYPTPNKDQALGQILQGGSRDLAKGEEALSAVNIKGVKTYEGLAKKLNDGIQEYVAKQDDILLKDKGVFKLDDLSTRQMTKPVADATGNIIIPSQAMQVNHVEDALTQLSELYQKIGDKALAKDAGNIIEKAKVTGLTKKEVNDIARQYNAEFGSKSFGKGANREPLTSVSAQAFENTRQGLKEVARRGLSGEAQEIDSTLSSIYNTKRLIEKNVEAVNRLRQKVDDRGVGEKIGRAGLTAFDVATMNIVKGAVLKMIPRGLGYKQKNWIDIEDSLSRNLGVLERANAAKTEAQLLKELNAHFSGFPSPEVADISGIRPYSPLVEQYQRTKGGAIQTGGQGLRDAMRQMNKKDDYIPF